MGVDLYTVQLTPADIAIRTALALTPLALVTVVSRRMGRGWLVMSIPWVLLLAAIAVYAAPAMKFSQTLGAPAPLVTFAHLVGQAAPISLFVTLAVLAVVGAKNVSTQSERA
jgi:hypothetical protein